MTNGNGNLKTLPANEPAHVLGQSVQKEDVAKYLGSGVVQFLVPAFGAAYAVDALPPQLPPMLSMAPYSKSRDILLSQLPVIEGNWANAIDIAVTKIIARGTQLESPVGRRIENVDKMLELCDGRLGFDVMLERSLQDYFGTSNGCWFEIERVSRAPGAKIVTFHHLDSLRVWRTGDPDVPAIYWDLQGHYHELNWWECFNVTDLHSARAGWWYGGECAAERVYRDVRAVAAMTAYFDEKITGSGFSKIVFTQSVTNDQMLNAIAVAKSENAAKGIAYYQGVVFIPSFGDVPQDFTKSEVMLKGMPDNWDREKELEIRQMSYAAGLGISPIDINPRLTARGAMGVGAQSQILDDAERGRVGAKFIKQFARHMNLLVTPDATVFSFPGNDLRDEKAKADIALARAQQRAAMRGTSLAPGEITPMQSLYLAIQDEDAPREFIDASTPVSESLTDADKPMSEQDSAALNNAESRQNAQDTAPAEQQPVPTDEEAAQKVKAKEVAARGVVGRFVSRDGLPAVWIENRTTLKAIATRAGVDPARLLLARELPRARELALLARQHAQLPVTRKETTAAPKAPQEDIVPHFHMHLPETMTHQIELLGQPAPVVTVNNQVNPTPLTPTINLPEMQPHVEYHAGNVLVAPPSVIVQNEVQPAAVHIMQPGETTETMTVVRDDQGLIARIIKKVTRR